MYVSFDELPPQRQASLLSSLALRPEERRLLLLRYVNGLDYSSIAAEMRLAKSSVGPLLTRARRHAVELARKTYHIAGDETRVMVDLLGWREVDWPVIYNRRRGAEEHPPPE